MLSSTIFPENNYVTQELGYGRKSNCISEHTLSPVSNNELVFFTASVTRLTPQSDQHSLLQKQNKIYRVISKVADAFKSAEFLKLATLPARPRSNMFWQTSL
jgi:hypothetical protein